MKRAVCPISGGMDSTVILHYIKKELKYDEIYCLSFDYGQRHSRELDYAKYHTQCVNASSHKILDIRFFKDISSISSLTNDTIDVAKTRDVLGDAQTKNYVPFRNMMMLSICSAYAETVNADAVFHGAAQIDSQAGYWDGSTEFLNAINQVNSLNRKNRIKVEAPLITKSKKEIIEMGVRLGVDFAKTHTCYEGKSIACGECPACSARIKGWIDALLIDPMPYNKSIPWGKFNCVEYLPTSMK